MSNFYCAISNKILLGGRKIFGILLFYLLISNIFQNDVKADKSGIIKIPKHDWSSQLVGAEVIGELMKMVGEKVEYIPMDSQAVYQEMAEGKIDIVNEIWERPFGASYDKAKASGNIEEILTHDAITREDWWYPTYVEEVCPGLPNWKALNNCFDKFTKADSNGKGVFIGGPKNWKKYNIERIDALGMNFVVKHASSAGGIWSQLDEAVAKKIPIVIYNWSPNFVGAKYDGKFVEFPKYHPKCTSDPTWGINPNAIYDCGNQADGYLKLAVNKDFKTNHPAGYKLIKKMKLSGSEIDKMAYYVDVEGHSIFNATQRWLAEYKFKWCEWIKN